jgi:hypothetical protein
VKNVVWRHAKLSEFVRPCESYPAGVRHLSDGIGEIYLLVCKMGEFSVFYVVVNQRPVTMWSFFKSFFGANESESAKSEIKAAVTEGLDIDAAIGAHQKWKIRLDDYVQGRSSEDLRPEVICFDDRCDLGKWIYSTGAKQLGRYPGFTALKEHHKMFHFIASNVVSLAQAGKGEEAKRMLLTTYENKSDSVIKTLRQLQELAEK